MGAAAETAHLGPAGLAESAAGEAVIWLLRSGIHTTAGGCHAWYDPMHGYQALYPEVTGYFLTLTAWLSRLLQAPCKHSAEHSLARPLIPVEHNELVHSAVRTLKWFRAVLLPDGSSPCLVDTDGPASGEWSGDAWKSKAQRRYTFDAGIILQGLVAWAAHDPSAGNAAVRLGDWVERNQLPNGTFTPYVGTESWQSAPADWSTRPGPHQAKTAIGMLALADLTGDDRYREPVRRTARALTMQQQTDGRFVTNPLAGSTNVHPHCYATEAAWAIGTASGDDAMLDAARRATRWILDASPSGQVIRVWHPTGRGHVLSPRVDGTAQVLRLAMLTGAGRPDEVQALTAALLLQQERHGGQRSRGGFRFGASSSGERLPHVNVWVTAFAVQALWLVAHAEDAALDWRYLA